MEKILVTEKEVREYIEEHNLTIDILTDEEVEQVREELIAIKSGQTLILDGALSDPGLHLRKIIKESKNVKRES